MKLGIVNSYEFCGDPSIVGHSHPLFSVKSTFFFLVYFLNKVDVEVSLSFQESQTENYLTQAIMIITFAEI